LLSQARGDLDVARAGHDRAIALAEKKDSQGLYVLRRSVLEFERGRLEEAHADAARALALEQGSAAPGMSSSWIGQAHLALPAC
jgi:hypothetical protein